MTEMYALRATTIKQTIEVTSIEKKKKFLMNLKKWTL